MAISRVYRCARGMRCQAGPAAPARGRCSPLRLRRRLARNTTHSPSTRRRRMLGTRFKLSAMMFLEFFIWGAWYPLVFGYLAELQFTALQQSMILIPFNIAALVALFFGTQFA